MEKLTYLLNRSLAAKDLKEFVTARLLPSIRSVRGRQVILNVADLDDAVRPVAPLRIMGRWGDVGAAVEFWLDSIDQRDRIEATLANDGIGFDGYLVTESVPQSYERNWPEGERRPGVTQFCALGKPPGVSEEHFYYVWQRKHAPQSFQLHPIRWSYIRNAVARPLTKDAPTYRAIVLEHFHELRDFTDDSRYLGDPQVVASMNIELPEFCDLNNIATGPMSEYYFDS